MVREGCCRTAALACFYLQIPVGHVEAEFRTRNLYSPWPEEFGCQAVDMLANWYFTGTEMSRRNLFDFSTDALRTTVREGYSHPRARLGCREPPHPHYGVPPREPRRAHTPFVPSHFIA